MIKGIRRSMKGEKSYEPKHISITPKSAITILPPKKIIKALYDYQAEYEYALGFNTGDFFHVIGREDDTEWYEACNPATNVRGLVPVAFFEVVEQKGRDSAGSGNSGQRNDADSGYSESGGQSNRMSKSGKTTGSPLYGVVQYDFHAERTDELEARAGDPILIIAQSTPEWFVAKPIGRLGGPGLIPVDFVEIRDMRSNVPYENKEEAIARAQVPKVEEWKKATAEYKNSSIALKKSPQEEYEASMARMSLNNHSAYRNSEMTQNGGTMGPPRNGASGAYSSLPAAISATVEKWTYENDRYWYIVQAVMEDGLHRTLCRNYEDFYDLQIALLQEFPEEAGQGTQKRLLPYMPGPVAYVNASISNARRTSLDEYVKELLALPTYISRCHLVKRLFVLRAGDVEHRQSSSHSNGHNGYGNDHYNNPRFSQNSGRSSDSSREPTHHSSAASLHNNSYPNRPSHSRTQSSSIAQAQQIHIRSAAGPTQTAISTNSSNPDLAPPRMNRQDSSMSQLTTASTSSSSAFIKVKIQYGAELIAVRLPRDVSFNQLQEKLVERLGTEVGNLRYKDESMGGYVALGSDRDLQVALSRNSKLVLYAS